MEASVSATRRQVPLDESEMGESRPKRARRAEEQQPDEQRADDAGSSSSARPTAAEAAAANKIITALRHVKVVPPLLAPKAGAETAVVACALALHFGEDFESDRDAKQSFGLHPSSDVRGRWVNGKLRELLKHDPVALREVAATFKGASAKASSATEEENTSPQKELAPAAGSSERPSVRLPPVMIAAKLRPLLGPEACAYVEEHYSGGNLTEMRMADIICDLVQERNDAWHDARTHACAQVTSDADATLEQAHAIRAEAQAAIDGCEKAFHELELAVAEERGAAEARHAANEAKGKILQNMEVSIKVKLAELRRRYPHVDSDGLAD